MQFRVGVVVLATAIITAILVLLFGKLPALVRGTYKIHVQFTAAPGVSPESPVRKSGILVGRVVKTELQKKGGVIVTIAVHNEVELTGRDVVRVNKPLLGDTSLDVTTNPDPYAPDEPLKDGDVVTGGVTPDPFEMLGEIQGKLGDTASGLNEAAVEVARLARNMNNLIGNNSEQFGRMITKTEKAIDSFQRAMSSIDDLVSDEQTKANLKRGLAELPDLLKETRTAVAGIQQTVESARANLNNLEGFTKPLASRGNDIVKNMDQGVGHLEQLLGQLAQFSKQLNSSEGTLSQLLNNPELYQQLNSAAKNVNDLTRELKPVIRDARVFSDKIARHPEVFTRGIIQPSSGLKGPSPIPTLQQEYKSVTEPIYLDP